MLRDSRLGGGAAAEAVGRGPERTALVQGFRRRTLRRQPAEARDCEQHEHCGPPLAPRAERAAEPLGHLMRLGREARVVARGRGRSVPPGQQPVAHGGDAGRERRVGAGRADGGRERWPEAEIGIGSERLQQVIQRRLGAPEIGSGFPRHAAARCAQLAPAERQQQRREPRGARATPSRARRGPSSTPPPACRR